MSFWQRESSLARVLLLGGVLLGASLPSRPAMADRPAAAPRLPTYNEARANSLKARRALVLLFGAKWCEPCKEFDRKVLSQGAVQQAPHLAYQMITEESAERLVLVSLSDTVSPPVSTTAPSAW